VRPVGGQPFRQKFIPSVRYTSAQEECVVGSLVLLSAPDQPFRLDQWRAFDLDGSRARASFGSNPSEIRERFGVKVSCQLRRSPKVLHPAARLRSSQISTRLLKVNPDCDLRSMQRKLIEEVRVAEIIVKIPVTNLGKDVTGDLAA